MRDAQNMRVMTYSGVTHGLRNPNNRAHKDRQILEFFLETLDINTLDIDRLDIDGPK